MENEILGQIDSKNRVTTKGFPIFFFIIAIIVLMIGLLLNHGNYRFIGNSRMTVGKAYYEGIYQDKDGNSYYEVYVKYAVDGKEYYERLKNVSAGSYTLIGANDGQDIVIYYNLENPSEVMDKSANYPRNYFNGFWSNFMLIGGDWFYFR